MTKNEIAQLPRESQEERYRQFYAALLSAPDGSEQAEKNRTMCNTIRDACGFTSNDIACLEAEVAYRYAKVLELMHQVEPTPRPQYLQ